MAAFTGSFRIVSGRTKHRQCTELGPRRATCVVMINESSVGQRAKMSVSQIQKNVVDAARTGDLNAATWWVQLMRDSGYSVGTATYNALLNAYRKSGTSQGIDAVLHKMIVEGVSIDETITFDALRTCIECRDVRGAVALIHFSRDYGAPVSINSANAVLKLLCQHSDYKTSAAFEEVFQGRIDSANTTTFNILISAYSKEGDFDSCFATYGKLLSIRKHTRIRPNIVTFNSLLDCLWRMKSRKRGIKPRINGVLRHMRRFKIAYDVRTATSLVKLASFEGEDRLEQVLKSVLARKEICLDRWFYDSVVEAFASVGQLRRCLEIIKYMEENDKPPTILTYNNALIACTKVKNGDSDARSIINKIRLSGLKPDSFTYCSLLASKQKRAVDETLRIIEEAMDEEVDINTAVQNAAILSAFDDVAAAQEVWKGLSKSLGLSGPKLPTVLAFVRVCGAAGRADMAVKAVYAMKKYGLEPDRTLYASFNRGFQAGDQGHSKVKPYLMILQTLCGVRNIDLPINRIRIRF